VSRRDATALVVAAGVLALYVGVSQKILTFLRPTMRPYLVASGLVLVAVGVVVLVRLSRESTAALPDDIGHEHHNDHDHEHQASRAGWFLLLPIVVAVVVAPGTLGTWAADRQTGVMFAGTHDFDLGPFLRAHSVAGTTPEMRLMDFLSAAADPDDRALLGEVNVRVIGFVNRVDNTRVRLDRFVVGCCVADAALLEVELTGPNRPVDLDNETWVQAEVRFDPAASPGAEAIRAGEPAMVLVESVRVIDAPAEPYEYLYG
jgi:uncharacterized repeat protein (TIGR03943 family)